MPDIRRIIFYTGHGIKDGLDVGGHLFRPAKALSRTFYDCKNLLHCYVSRQAGN